MSVACAAAGLHYESFRRWRARHEAGDPIAVEQFGDFFVEVYRVLALAEIEAVRVVRAGAPGWRASAWFLERRFPKRWGRKYRVSYEPVSLPVERMTDEELRAIVAGKRPVGFDRYGRGTDVE